MVLQQIDRPLRQFWIEVTATSWRCFAGVSGVEINAREEKARAIAGRSIGSSGTFNGCIQLCDSINECEAVSYNPDTDDCRGFKDATTNGSPDGDWVATIVDRVDSTTTSDSRPPPGLSPEAALKAVHERNQKVETENAFLQQQLANLRTLMENDREARERDRVERETDRASLAQEKASCELLRT